MDIEIFNHIENINFIYMSLYINVHDIGKHLYMIYIKAVIDIYYFSNNKNKILHSKSLNNRRICSLYFKDW